MKLLPCPFCGVEAELERVGTRRQSCVVVCTECGVMHESADEGDSSGSSWNRRYTNMPPEPSPIDAESMLYKRGEADGRRGHPPAELTATYLRGYSDGQRKRTGE